MPTNEIQIGRPNAVLHKLLAMKEGAPAPVLATDIFPVLVLENDRPEWKFLGGERLCSSGAVQAAAVGNYAKFSLTNPADSSTLVVIEKIVGWTTAAAQMDMQIRQYDGAAQGAVTLQASGHRDSRGFWAPGGARTTATFAVLASAAQYGNMVATISLAGGSLGIPTQLEMDWIMDPGRTLSIQGGTANQQMGCSVFWRERSLGPSETR